MSLPVLQPAPPEVRFAGNMRILHVQIPEPIFNRAKAQALLLGMNWSAFVVDLLNEASSSLEACSFKSKQN